MQYAQGLLRIPQWRYRGTPKLRERGSQVIVNLDFCQTYHSQSRSASLYVHVFLPYSTPTIDDVGELTVVMEHGTRWQHALACKIEATQPHSVGTGHSSWSLRRRVHGRPYLFPVKLAGLPSLLHWLLSWSVLMSSCVVTVGGICNCLSSLQPFCSFLMSYSPHCDIWENGSSSQSSKLWAHWNLCRQNWEIWLIRTMLTVSRQAFSMCGYALESWIWPTSAHTEQYHQTSCFPGVGLENLVGETKRGFFLALMIKSIGYHLPEIKGRPEDKH